MLYRFRKRTPHDVPEEKKSVASIPPRNRPVFWEDITAFLTDKTTVGQDAEAAMPAREGASPSGLDRKAAELYSLALSAQAIPHQLDFKAQSGLHLSVPRRLREKALDELRAWQAEEEAARRETEELAAKPPAIIYPDPFTPIFIGALLIFHLLVNSRPDFMGLGIDWRAGGMADASLIKNGEWYRLFTALTLHGDIIHLLSNVLLGGIFFTMAAKSIGSGTSLLLLVICGGTANLLSAWYNDWNQLSIGASGMVFAAIGTIAGLNALKNRRLNKRDLFLGIGAGLAILAMLGGPGKRIDFSAHAFGFALGALAGLAISLISSSGIKRPLWSDISAGIAAFLLISLSWAAALRQ